MIKFLVNGLLRDRQRSLIPILVVTIGVCITVFFHAYLRGTLGEMIDSTARFQTGHIKIMSRAYAENSDQKPNDLSLIGVGQIAADLTIVFKFPLKALKSRQKTSYTLF